MRAKFLSNTQKVQQMTIYARFIRLAWVLIKSLANATNGVLIVATEKVWHLIEAGISKTGICLSEGHAGGGGGGSGGPCAANVRVQLGTDKLKFVSGRRGDGWKGARELFGNSRINPFHSLNTDNLNPHLPPTRFQARTRQASGICFIIELTILRRRTKGKCYACWNWKRLYFGYDSGKFYSCILTKK